MPAFVDSRYNTFAFPHPATAYLHFRLVSYCTAPDRLQITSSCPPHPQPPVHF
jgi:hypothetical protein